MLTWWSLHIFMGIHHSSDTKTCHDHDNNCQKRHSTASLTNGQRGGRAQTEARGGSAGCRLRRLARGFALGAARVRFGGARRSAPTCDSLPRTTKPNLAACLPPANPPARQASPASHNAQHTTMEISWNYIFIYIYYRSPISTIWVVYRNSGF